ncbi:putative phage abortive infection protein [Pseudochryseolinea flava]|uniref:Phage abortive infection protein n=1 Tax=Pseudochryseolinea flava TaxID=2059302 RepID=A0A364Y491_9BACT|nr:putative phage abortive infection protein [Pseudochryseolinea flava]RAW01559.1 hypothetical protein DQQ10_07830 [Pseudochryseolinea flava]
MKSNRLKEIKTYDKEFWWYFAGFCGLVFLISWIPLILTQYSWGFSIGRIDANEIGDAIGGTLGPMVALLASALTFLAFWVQYKANQQQRYDIKVERFENKFYEMLRLHNDTVSEIEIAGRHSGRKAFIYLFDEFRFVYRIVEHEYDKWNSRSEVHAQVARLSYDKEKLAEFAYKMFFFGVGEQSDKATMHTHNVHTPFYIKTRNILKRLQNEYRRQSGNGSYVKLIYSSYPPIDLDINYVPFDGHVSKLGHYYRHLYQTVRFINQQEDLEDTYSFMKTLRAQLSNHEQLLLYYNSFFVDLWWTEKLFLISRIVKNIPLYLSDIGPDPVERFRKAIKIENPKISDASVEEELGELLEWYNPANEN